MKSIDFLDIMSEVDESLLARCDADRGAPLKRFWKPLTAIAAAFAAAPGIRACRWRHGRRCREGGRLDAIRGSRAAADGA